MTLIKKIDRAIYRCERLFVVAALLLMATVVFLDVVHRLFAAPHGGAQAWLRVANLLGFGIESGSPADARVRTVATPLWAAGCCALGYFGIRFATRREPWSPMRAASYAILGTAVAYGGARLLVVMFPNGLIWSQDLALVLTLWVGFLGASMCTFENKHLRVEAIERALPLSLRRWTRALGAIATAFVCLALGWLSLRYIVSLYGDYRAADGQGGLIVSLGAPKYLCFSVLPIAFGMMSLRFFGGCVAALGRESRE